MSVDYFENGLCFYCHLAEQDLLHYADFNSRTEELWRREDQSLQQKIEEIMNKYPQSDRDEIVDSYAWDLHLNQYKYPDIHRSTVIITVYTFLEDQLNGLCAVLGESLRSSIRLKDLHGQGIERACLFLSKVALFNLGHISKLTFVKEVGLLRNKLIHAGGILSSNCNDTLNKFVDRTDGLWGEPGEQVRIGPEFFDFLINELIKFIKEIDSEVDKFMERHQS